MGQGYQVRYCPRIDFPISYAAVSLIEGEHDFIQYDVDTK